MRHYKNRQAAFEIDSMFLERISSRSFDPKKSVDRETLMKCFEAARWAPSSYNGQPWRFVYAYKGSHAYQEMTDCLVEFNKNWCKNVPVLILVCSRIYHTHNNKPATTHSFDTGSSFMSFILQAEKLGLITHAMEGIDRVMLRHKFHIPEIYQVEILLACGYKGDENELSEELKKKETPSERLPLESQVSEGKFIFS